MDPRAGTRRPAPGNPILLSYRKWDGRVHWQTQMRYLGADTHGDWLGTPAGSVFWRPGIEVTRRVAEVELVPVGRGFTTTFSDWSDDEADAVAEYTDLTTPPVWLEVEGLWTVTAVDLDLDVVRRVDGHTYVDDEDEFAEHRRLLGYPADVVDATEAECRRLYEATLARSAPYDGSAQPWLEQARRLTWP